MILRRFMKHVTDQNWFAVGLDVLVVITGIFLGMQVTEWNEGRQGAELGQKLRASLIEDLEEKNNRIDRILAYNRVSVEFAISSIDWLEGKSLEPIPEKRRLVQLYLPLADYPVGTNSATYTQMITNGTLYLLGDDALQNRVVRYYENVQRLRLYLAGESSHDYRDAFRSIVSPLLYNQLVNRCILNKAAGEFGGSLRHELTDRCELDFPDEDLLATLAALGKVDGLVKKLRQRTINLMRQSEILERVLDGTELLLVQLNSLRKE